MQDISALAKWEEVGERSWEEYVVVGQSAREYKDVTQWLLGRLALGVEKDYGTDSLGKYASAIGVNLSTLQRYRWVVKHFPGEKVSEPKILPFYAYEALATTQNPQEWVQKAVDEDWPAHKLVQSLRAFKRGVTIEQLKQVECPSCHYRFVPQKGGLNKNV